MREDLTNNEGAGHGDEAYHALLREVYDKFSGNTGSQFFSFASGVARAITKARLGKFLEFRRIAVDLGRADRVDALLFDVLQGRRSADSALESAAELVKSAEFPTCKSLPESRLALREALGEIFQAVPLLTEPTGTAGDDQLSRLRSAFQILKLIPIETEMEPGDLQSLQGLLDLIDNHLPALRLCGEYRDDWRSLVERFNRHHRTEEGASGFQRAAFWRDSKLSMVRIASVGPQFDVLSGEEILRGGVLLMHLEQPKYLVADLSAARALAFQAIDSMLALAQVARSRGVVLQIVTGKSLFEKVQRLLPTGLLTFQKTLADCEEVIRKLERGEG